MLPWALLLGVVVVLAAGIGGTAHFTGPRWFPNLGGSTRHHNPFPVPHFAKLPSTPKVHGKTGSITLPLWLELVGLVLVIVGIVALVLWLRARQRTPAVSELHATSVQVARQPAVVEPEPEPEALITGIELALQRLDQVREPGDAIVRAWIGLQETAAESGIVRRPSETPTEFTARILSGAFADDRALHTLLRLYLRTRFGDHPVTAADVADVREALAQLLASWRAPAGATAGAGRG